MSWEMAPLDVDRETGELNNSTIIWKHTLRNAETGEREQVPPESNKKSNFKIPITNVNRSTCYKSEKTSAFSGCGTKLDFPGSSSCIEQKVKTVSSNVSPILFMFPTVIFFPALFAVILAGTEIFIHMWVHKKLKQTPESYLKYRSPLHIITSEFCAYCQSDKLMTKIGRLQDERKVRIDNKKLAYYRLAKKMSVIS